MENLLPNATAECSIGVIGAGIAGLATAHEIRKRNPAARVSVFERTSRAGGLIQSYRENGFLVESAADCLYTFPTDGIELCRELGLEPKFVPPNQTPCIASIWHEHRFHPLPPALIGAGQMTAKMLFGSTLLSLFGKLRCCLEPLIRPRREDQDESCRSFFTRRLGHEFTTKIVEPVLSAIHAIPCDRLSMAAVMPHMVLQEKKFGSLVKGANHSFRSSTRSGSSQNGISTPASLTFPNGMDELIQALIADLPPDSLQIDSPIRSITNQSSKRWRIEFADPSRNASVVDAVVVACPASVAARLLIEADEQLPRDLLSIKYQSVVVIAAAFDKQHFPVVPNAHGIFMGRGESYPFRSLSISSEKFCGRAPVESILFRVSVHPVAGRTHDPQLVDDVVAALQRLFQISGPPVFQHVVVHESGLAQYEVGHSDKIACIDNDLKRLPGLFLTGSGYRGAGVVRCIQDAKRVAGLVADFLGSPDRPGTGSEHIQGSCD